MTNYHEIAAKAEQTAEQFREAIRAGTKLGFDRATFVDILDRELTSHDPNNDQFRCEDCGAIGDIEDSNELDHHYYCDPCAAERARHGG